MPIEHEVKHVLRDAEALRDALGTRLPYQLIDQVYVGPGARYRRIERRDAERPHHTFTYKHVVEGRVLEQEMPVHTDDFELARRGAVSCLSKVRYSLDDGDGTHWDVDFLLDAPAREGGRLYFAMAEVEFPEDAGFTVPNFLAPHVAFAVPRGHGDLFSNARLTDRDYAATLVERWLAGWRGETEAARPPGP